MGSKEADKKYKQKRYQADKALGELYRGIGGQSHESFGDFKKRIKKLI